MRVLALASMLLAPAGPWVLTLPVAGLTDDNAAEFARLVKAHFATLKDDSGDPVALDVRAKGSAATITVNCAAGIRASDLAKALEGSPFSLAPETWEAAGRVGLEWRRKDPLPEDARERLVAAFTKAAPGADKVEVVQEGDVCHLHLRLGDNRVRVKPLLALAKEQGLEGATLVWERWPHMPWYDTEASVRTVKEDAE